MLNMHAISSITTIMIITSTAQAVVQGFNYGAENQLQSDFENKFKIAKNLPGTNGRFSSARLYTMIQHNTVDDIISAIPAAIKTNTSLLLGLWASAGQVQFNNELTAFRKAIGAYGSQLQELVVGISVGSEDLYRSTPIGRQNNAGQGAEAASLVEYIGLVRGIIKDTPLKDIAIGHVDTWTAYMNQTNAGLIKACDWLGMDAYPYFEHNISNPIDQGQKVFQGAIDKAKQAAGGKPIWVTETGWPTVGAVFGQAVASIQNSERYYKTVGCSTFADTNTWWFTLQDTGESPSFGVLDANDRPLFDLSCGDLRLNITTVPPQVDQTTQPASMSTSAIEDTQTAINSALQMYCST